MSELTLTAIRLGLLVLLWVFVFSVAGVLRGDLYGTRVVKRKQEPAAAPKQATPKPSKRVPTTMVVTQGGLTGTTVPLKPSGVLLGRNPECTLVLDDDFASGRHARLYQGPEGWVLEDLGSTNGTYLDDQRVTTSQLVRTGSAIRIGKTVIELRR
ncbi:MAG TPA: FHA domain-containing protein [Dermatophilaceae bacterium]|nr:FHA domain-containing protein [Dermatophilaceae bacterium]